MMKKPEQQEGDTYSGFFNIMAQLRMARGQLEFGVIDPLRAE